MNSPSLTGYRRLTFQEIMSLAPLQDEIADGKITKRYMSQRKAWCPIEDVPIASEKADPEQDPVRNSQPLRAAYGGHVYSQAGMAATRALAEIQASQSSSPKELGIHVSHFYSPSLQFTYHCVILTNQSM